MTQTKHTPGPWLVHTSDYGSYVECDSGYPICGNVNDRPDGFNAQLIAAAPDLLEALDVAVTSMLDSGYNKNAVVIRKARAAIANYRKGSE